MHTISTVDTILYNIEVVLYKYTVSTQMSGAGAPFILQLQQVSVHSTQSKYEVKKLRRVFSWRVLFENRRRDEQSSLLYSGMKCLCIVSVCDVLRKSKQ